MAVRIYDQTVGQLAGVAITTTGNGTITRDGLEAYAQVMMLADASGTIIDLTGFATAANQVTANGYLATIATNSADTTAVNVYPLPTTPTRGLTAQMTGTTSTAVTGMGAGGSGVFNYITSITISNTDIAVGTLVELQDGSGGTSFASFPAPKASAAGDVNGATFTFPTPIKQPTANTALYCKNVTTSAETILFAVGFQA